MQTRSGLYSASACALAVLFAVSCAPGDSALKQARQSSTANSVLVGYFESNVVSRFQVKNCQSCHNSAQAGASIFDYDTMRALLMRGPTRDSNDLVRKTANFIPHAGGDGCGYIGGEPCATISRWWDREVASFQPGGGGTPSTAPDLIAGVSVNGQTGQITGYAFDRNGFVASPLQVELYMGGPAGSGTLLSSQAANQNTSSPPFRGGFSHSPAAMYVNAVPRKLYAYYLDPLNGNARVLITGAAADFIAGADASGQAAFTNTVLPQLGQCTQCHGSLFTQYFETRSRLSIPSPLDGGSATNNRIYLKVTGAIGHGGGNRCGQSSICSALQTWYATDFGN